MAQSHLGQTKFNSRKMRFKPCEMSLCEMRFNSHEMRFNPCTSFSLENEFYRENETNNCLYNIIIVKTNIKSFIHRV